MKSPEPILMNRVVPPEELLSEIFAELTSPEMTAAMIGFGKACEDLHKVALKYDLYERMEMEKARSCFE